MPGKIIGSGQVQAGPAQVSATGRTRMNLAVHHMMGAALFSKRAREIEVEHDGESFGAFYDEIIWNVSAATLLTVAALEAYINEIFLNARNYFSVDVERDINKRWKKIERLVMLKKYQEALRLKGKQEFDKGSTVYQNLGGLIKARNALIHFQPQWHDEEKSHRKIEQRLKGKFTTSPFMGEGASFFPNRCMTYGFAKWGVDVAMMFATEFSDRSGILNKFLKFKDRIDGNLD